MWTRQRLVDYRAEQTGLGLSPECVRLHLQAAEIVWSRPQHKISRPDPQYAVKKRRSNEATRDHLKSAEVFYYADEFKVSWMPSLGAMGSPVGQQIMIRTPGQPPKQDGIGAVN
jgi:hypothetical protein